MIKRAWDLGLTAVAITDHDCVSGAHKAIKFFNKFIQEKYGDFCAQNGIEYDPNKSVNDITKILNFKLILGNEIYLTREGLNEQNCMIGESFYHLILLAKDKIGHRQIRELSSRAWERAWFRAILRTPTYSSDLFEVIKGGHLVATTACLGGYTGSMVKSYLTAPDEIEVNAEGEVLRYPKEHYLNKIDNFLAMMNDMMGSDNFYIELQPSCQIDQIDYNSFMIKNYWGSYNFIYATDSHYLRKDDREVHKAFLNSKSSKEREVDSFYSSAYLMGQEELESYFDYIEPAKIEIMRQNSLKVSDMCSMYTLEQDQQITKVPYEDIEDCREVFNVVDLEKHPYFNYFMTTTDETDSYFMKLVARGFSYKYKDNWEWDRYIARLEEEFWTIREISVSLNKPLADYFISMHKMIDIIWNEADSIVGPSRGSAGALFCNYLLGITQMNPLEQELELPVWRFAHPSRPELADIDIDTESSKRLKVFNKVQQFFRKDGGDLINICTFGTEGTKSALKTSARGLNINDDVITFLTSMIPNERGFDWTLNQCYYGDEEHTAIKAFKEEIDNYPELWKVATEIEGLVTRLGVHASGVVAVNNNFVDYNSYMKTTKQQTVSAFDLHDSEEMGLIKYDFLTVSALDRIRQTINYLLEDKIIPWCGSLRETYDKYFAPDVLNYSDMEMWDLVTRGEITALFQFDTLTGSQAIKEIKPRSLTELAIANSVMRLMGSGELPLETYAKYKENIQLWYNELRDYNLTEDEVKILEKHLLKLSGVADSQESVMMLSMDPKISGFSMAEANKLRKTIAKKQFREIQAVKDLFFEKGKACGTSTNLLSYIWFVQITRQLGYSFSSIHTTGYSLIALQEMNLACYYPIIYWNTACLSVDSSAISEEDFYNLIDEEIINVSDTVDTKSANKMDYGKIAQAIEKFKKIGIKIDLPDINKSRLSFTPNAEENRILYGLKGIARVTAPVIDEIIMNRPFTSLKDFINRTTSRMVTKDKVINLIKCGAFNKVEHKTTEEILRGFLWETCEPKKKLTLQNANMLINFNLIPDTYSISKTIFTLTKELRKNRDKNKFYYVLNGIVVSDPETKELWLKLLRENSEIKDMMIEGEQVKVIDSDRWDKYVYEPYMDKIRNYIKANHDTLLDQLNKQLFKNEWDKYVTGDEAQFELDSISFYYTYHPLVNIIPQIAAEITPIDEIKEGDQEGWFFIKGKEIPKMKIYAIAGTVIDKDKPKGLVTIQTPEGIVNLKVYKDLFAIYNHTLSTVDEVGQKNVLEDSFFEKGTHLLVHGILRGATFIPKVYKNTGCKSILKIELDEFGNFVGLSEKGE